MSCFTNPDFKFKCKKTPPSLQHNLANIFFLRWAKIWSKMFIGFFTAFRPAEAVDKRLQVGLV